MTVPLPAVIFDRRGAAVYSSVRRDKRTAQRDFAATKGISWFWLWCAGYRCRRFRHAFINIPQEKRA